MADTNEDSTKQSQYFTVKRQVGSSLMIQSLPEHHKDFSIVSEPLFSKTTDTRKEKALVHSVRGHGAWSGRDGTT